MDGVDHQLQRRIDQGTGFLGIEVFDQLHRSFDVREQRGDRLALAGQLHGRMVCSALAK
jgi:hypothetical protein